MDLLVLLTVLSLFDCIARSFSSCFVCARILVPPAQMENYIIADRKVLEKFNMKSIPICIDIKFRNSQNLLRILCEFRSNRAPLFSDSNKQASR